MNQLYLSRRNLETLLSKLDRVKNGEFSHCTIVKNETNDGKYPQTIPTIWVTAVENNEYYHDRMPGPVVQEDQENLT